MDILKPSVQSLLVEMLFDGTQLATGTAFVVTTKRGPCLITNRHNVTGRRQDTGECISKTGGVPNQIRVWHNMENKLLHWIPKLEPLFVNGAKRWIEHPTLGERADFVALPMVESKDVSFIPYDTANPGNDFPAGPSDAVSVIGFPFGITGGGMLGIWSTGFIASEPDVNFNDLPQMLIDCRTRQGQSGSPVLAFKGQGSATHLISKRSLISGPIWRLLGIYSGRINSESDLGLVWKTKAIDELVQSL
jgi:hypothetical protein